MCWTTHPVFCLKHKIFFGQRKVKEFYRVFPTNFVVNLLADIAVFQQAIQILAMHFGLGQGAAVLSVVEPILELVEETDSEVLIAFQGVQAAAGRDIPVEIGVLTHKFHYTATGQNRSFGIVKMEVISGDDFHFDYPKGPVLPGGRVVELMRKYPNLHGDISAGSGLNALKRDKDFAISFLNEFQDRLYYGQDCCSLAKPKMHSEYLDGLLENGDISQEVYNKICWKNAVKLLDLPLTEKDFML